MPYINPSATVPNKTGEQALGLLAKARKASLTTRVKTRTLAAGSFCQTLSDEEVLAHLYILLVAGHETTTTLAAWTLYLLATQPTYREQVEAELQEQLAGSSGPLSVEAARNLHRLDLSSSRKKPAGLHSPVQSVPRRVVTDTEFAGYTFPGWDLSSTLHFRLPPDVPLFYRSSYV